MRDQCGVEMTGRRAVQLGFASIIQFCFVVGVAGSHVERGQRALEDHDEPESPQSWHKPSSLHRSDSCSGLSSGSRAVIRRGTMETPAGGLVAAVTSLIL